MRLKKPQFVTAGTLTLTLSLGRERGNLLAPLAGRG
jgi:hypothetical protein